MALTLDGTTGITASGNITGNYILGNGSQLSGIITSVSSLSNGTSNVAAATSGGNITVGVGGTPNVAVFTTTGANIAGTLNATGNANTGNLGATNVVATNLTGTLQTAAQTNITSVGTLGSLSVTGNITGGNLLTGGNIVDTGAMFIITGASGNVTLAPNGTNMLVATTTGANIAGTLNATGNVTGSYFFGNGSQLTGIDATAIQNGTSNVRVAASGNVTVSAAGTANVLVVTSTGANIAGTLNTGTSNANVGNLGATTVVATTLTGTLSTAAQTNITSVGPLGSLAVTGNITSGNLSVSTGTVTLGGVVNANGNGVGNIGSATTYFNTVFAQATSAQYADLAENYVADKKYEIGTVLRFGGPNEVTESDSYHDTRIAGTVSENPAYLMNSGLNSENAVAVALMGRVPCRVVGTINKGDRLVASNIQGVATVLDLNCYQPGCIIGKSLEAYDSDHPGVIEIVVGRL